MVPVIFEPSFSLISSARAGAANCSKTSAAKLATAAADMILRLMRLSIAPERASGKGAHAMVAGLVSKSRKESMSAWSRKARDEAPGTEARGALTTVRGLPSLVSAREFCGGARSSR